MKNKLNQVDIIKGLAILTVVFLHLKFVNMNFFIKIFSMFHIAHVVTVFMIVMGFNAALSFQNKKHARLSEYYAKTYIVKRCKRTLIPFLMVFSVSVLFGIYTSQLNLDPVMLISGYLPFSVRANYFIPLIFQSAALMPLLYWFYTKRPRLLLWGCFLINVLFQGIAIYTKFYMSHSNFYHACILRYLFPVALGIWISDDYNLSSRRNRFILLGSVLSIIFLFSVNLHYYNLPYLYHPALGGENILAYFYALMFVMLGLKFLPDKGWNLIAYFGKASYHFYLIQIIDPFSSIVKFLLSSILGGMLFYEVETNLTSARRPMRFWNKSA